MPVKTPKIHHRIHHSRHKRTKRYLKVYAPYLPLLLIVSLGIFLSTGKEFQPPSSGVLSYATNISRQGLLESTNQQRYEKGENGLRLNDKLGLAAQLKAEDMAARNYWSHNTPDGKEPWFFFDKVGYKYFKAAENLAYGFNTSDAAVNGWMNSPPHRANLLDNNLSEVGFGIANVSNYQNNGPQTVVVAMYGLPVDRTAIPASTNNQPSAQQPQEILPKEEEKITYVQMLTGGKAPWSSFLAGLLIGAIVMYLVIKHVRSLRRVLIYSERFIIRHPLLDTTLVALLALAAVLSRTVGVIH